MNTRDATIQPRAINGLGPSVLYFDRDQVALELLCGILAKNNYRALSASTCAETLELVATALPSIVIIDLDEGVDMDVLRAIRRINPGCLLMAASSSDEREIGERFGLVFCTIEKPVCTPDLLAHMERALRFLDESKSRLDLVHGSDARLRGKLEWLLWKEKAIQKRKLSPESLLLRNIKHSMSQGLGFGGLLTQIELIQMMVSRDGETASVPWKAFDCLFSAAFDMREWFEKLDRISSAFQMPVETSTMKGAELAVCVAEATRAVEKLRAIKNQDLVLADLDIQNEIICTNDLLQFCLRELLTNAFKYSPEGSSIHILKFRTLTSVTIAVVNDITEMVGGITGIPEEMQNLVFEPFYRLNNTYDERFRDEELALGIGLTVLQSAINQCGGGIAVYEVVDYATDDSPRRRIVAEITLKVASGDSR